ncbi:MAG: YceI family protein [Gallionellaceae bacterium]
MLKQKMFAVLFAASLPLAAMAADSYTIDPPHTFPRFMINHLGFSTMEGRFDKTSGKVTLDRAAKKGSIDITIDASSVSTGFAKRDEHLRSPDFFNVVEFPTITYKSNSIKFKGDTPSSVDGELTMAGVTKPVTLTIDDFNCGPDPMEPLKKKQKCGAAASAEIKRSDFGIKFGLPAVGDDVKFVLEVEAYKD